MKLHEDHPDRPGVVDLRSDTVTQPTDAMRRAMAEAEVGDSLFGEDPTVAKLEKEAARRTGKEAALFVPTGSMGNLVAMLSHTEGRREVIAERRSHILNYEAGSLAGVAGCTAWPIDAPGGVFTPEQLEAAVRPAFFAMPRTGLVVIENTHNGWGGSVWSPGETSAVAMAAKSNRLPVHCDGARIFNSAIAQKVSASALVRDCDTVMFCFSKGLSAPVGSVLCGDRGLIERAVRHRKMVGGAMRQAGVLAAAALVAIDTMVDRLAEDHSTARRLADSLQGAGYGVDPERCPTNIVVFDTRPAGWKSADAFVRAAEKKGVRALTVSRTEVRFVTHRHVTPEKTAMAIERLERLRP